MIDPHADTPVAYYAALWAAIGGAAKLSKSGLTPIFAQPQLGRSDLSGRAGYAQAPVQDNNATPRTW